MFRWSWSSLSRKINIYFNHTKNWIKIDWTMVMFFKCCEFNVYILKYERRIILSRNILVKQNVPSGKILKIDYCCTSSKSNQRVTNNSTPSRASNSKHYCWMYSNKSERLLLRNNIICLSYFNIYIEFTTFENIVINQSDFYLIFCVISLDFYFFC